MKTKKPYRKFLGQQKIIKKLEETNSRFKRVYSEYELMSEQLWDLETTEGISIPDDFLQSIKLQASYLEEEIEDWLLDSNSENTQ